MTSMSDLSRVQSETLSHKLYSTRRGTDFIKGPENRGKKRSLLPHATRAAANYQFDHLSYQIFALISKEYQKRFNSNKKEQKKI